MRLTLAPAAMLMLSCGSDEQPVISDNSRTVRGKTPVTGRVKFPAMFLKTLISLASLGPSPQ